MDCIYLGYEKDCYKKCKQENCKIKNCYIAEGKLEKIKEIAKNQTSSCCSMRNKECDYSCNICHLKALKDILQIIGENK